MRFGVCAPVSEARNLAEIGFDYIEVSVALLAEMTDEQFAAFCAENDAAPIHAEAANCMFPGSLRLTGENADFAAVQSYLDRAMARLQTAGVSVAVFGSGGSRRVPEGFPKERAWAQLVKVGRMLGETAQKYGVTVALEPLRRAETNILNTQLEGLHLVQDVAHPHFKLLCDYYHLIVEGGTMADVEACAGQLVHTHISNPENRAAMTPADRADYKSFFAALRRIGYDARMSFEGSAPDPEKQLPVALEVMKNA
ncbi:MAG: sugar phosphate isomerase/epimerase [Ruminococcus bromii]|nr:sugar phosphate isomerase/epimerase [Ruminococcus bromii]